ncbi:Topoisomerase IV subunit A [hydrothermal vent metagenome]|uniref:Topoisomerase IV subunit A n=1 Tax=hydrothermal vent metagenome TaxID=652676 RepID=A0A3B0RP26_9ZZZZ
MRLMVDMGNDDAITAAFVYQGTRKFLVASSSGHGFIVAEQDCLSNTRKGKQVLNVPAGAEAAICRPAPAKIDAAHMIASIGDNKKFLVFPAAQLPEMSRGKGVVLQKFQKGGLSDAKVFSRKDGLTWTDRSGRIQTVEGWKPYLGKRAQAGRIAPKGFPTSKTFGPD